MELASLILTYNKCNNSDKSTEFEKDFISSIVKNACKYSESQFIPNDVFHLANRHLKLQFSEKQMNIYNSIKEKYNPDSNQEDLYHKYSEIFKQKGIVLDSFDQRHLNTFKSITNESENFKKWLLTIIKS